MHCQILHIIELESVGFAGHADVALFEEEASVVVSDEDPGADVELTFVDEHGQFNVLLHHEDIGFDNNCDWLLAWCIQFFIRFLWRLHHFTT
jgi:hypothetical protein